LGKLERNCLENLNKRIYLDLERTFLCTYVCVDIGYFLGLYSPMLAELYRRRKEIIKFGSEINKEENNWFGKLRNRKLKEKGMQLFLGFGLGKSATLIAALMCRH
jgi:hypothetical protein